MTQLVGFRVSRAFPLSPRFYCLPCTETLSREKRWESKVDSHRKGAAPIIVSTGGFIRYLRVPAASTPSRRKAAGWLVDDDALSITEEAILEYLMGKLGLRAVPSIPVPAELDLRCKNCGVGILAAPGQLLSSQALTDSRSSPRL